MHLCIVDCIPAQKEIWFIGDSTLREFFRSFIAIRNQAQLKDRPKPYTFDYYNIICKTADVGNYTKNTLGRMLNALIDALNTRVQIPRMVVIIPDWDLIKNFKHVEFGTTYMAGRSIAWLSNEIEKLFEIRKDQYLSRRKESVAAFEPKIIWVKMLHRPAKCLEMKFCRKFNESLNDTLALYKDTYVMDLSIPDTKFD